MVGDILAYERDTPEFDKRNKPVVMKDNPKKNGVIIKQIKRCPRCELCMEHDPDTFTRGVKNDN